MNAFVPLQNALKQNRYKEVVRGVLSAFDTGPLNNPEIIQLGELALKAIARDSRNQRYKHKILKKLGDAYSAMNKHGEAKEVYRELYENNKSWDDLYGLLNSLGESGELDELKQQLQDILPQFYIEKRVPQLKIISELLKNIGALASLNSSVEFWIAQLEGDVEKVGRLFSQMMDDLDEVFLRDSNWEKSESFAGVITFLSQENRLIANRLFIKKIYESLMWNGPKGDYFKALLKYYENTDSKHIGYFFSQNPGVKVELPAQDWIDSLFLKSSKLERPQEIDIELDLGADLFEESGELSSSMFKNIKTLEARISFLLKHNEKDEARNLYKELLKLDPNNTKFQDSFEAKDDNSSSKVNKNDDWGAAWKTLAEIEQRANESIRNDSNELKISWKTIADEDLLENYLEYAYSMILINQERSCLKLLDKVLSLNSESFKDASYLKARCYQNIGKHREAVAVAQSIVESCSITQEELLELNYVQAESLSEVGECEKSLTLFKSIYKLNPKYRLVKMKIEALEQGR